MRSSHTEDLKTASFREQPLKTSFFPDTVRLSNSSRVQCCHFTKGFDVFNALDLMANKTFLEKLKFGIGDGNLQYYLYNWKCPGMEPEKVGLVLQ